MDTFEFDGKKYKSASRHQKEWGNDLILQLSLSGNETILDLGCGDGILTKRLSLLVPHGNVLGIDASANMVETAKTLCGNNLEFARIDINEMTFEHAFDLIFSNAALHWVKNHKRLLTNAHKALKIHGEVLWDFGSAGNCANFFEVMHGKISETKYAKYFPDFTWPWFMPSKSQYMELISTIGFSSYEIAEINRDRYFSDASEMIKWIDQPSIVPFINQIPEELKESFRQEVIEEMLQKTRQPNGTHFETFRRIRVHAQK